MSSSSSATVSAILRGSAAEQVSLACLDADLRTSPYASCTTADARLVDPTLAKVLDDAVTTARAQAREDGFARGYADGLAVAAVETRQTVEAELTAMRAAEADRVESLRRCTVALDAAGAAFAQRQAATLVEIDDVLLSAAVQLATALVGRELALLDSPVRDAVRRALAVLPADVPVSITVHPSDVAVLAELPDDVSAGRRVHIDTDPQVEPGSCRADGGFRHVEASLSAALDRVRQVLGC